MRWTLGWWAHPRSRGENSCIVVIFVRRVGSSPLTRGKQLERGPNVAGLGLIPAHAGKTGHLSLSVESAWAHPRSRGENATRLVWPVPEGGSSPLTRGKHESLVHVSGDLRLIPAHAGKTSWSWSVVIMIVAHPRSRGENSPPSRPASASPGSSPLTRGKPRIGPVCRNNAGLIPAHAGKTYAGPGRSD